MRRKLQKRQRSRRALRRRMTRRRQKAGGLPVPAGSLVGVSTGGEYGVPILITKESYEKEKEKGSLDD